MKYPWPDLITIYSWLYFCQYLNQYFFSMFHLAYLHFMILHLWTPKWNIWFSLTSNHFVYFKVFMKRVIFFQFYELNFFLFKNIQVNIWEFIKFQIWQNLSARLVQEKTVLFSYRLCKFEKLFSYFALRYILIIYLSLYISQYNITD